MEPALFKVFVSEFTKEWNRLQAESGAGVAGKQAALNRDTQQIERLVDALATGTPAIAVNARLETL